MAANTGDRVKDQIINANENRQRFMTQGDEDEGYLKSREGYYDTLGDDYRGQADTAYGDLAQTPGYTDEESAAIRGDPNAAFKYYNPSAIAGDLDQSAANVNRATGDYSSDLKGAAGRVGSDVTGAAGKLGSDVTGAANRFSTGLTGAAGQSKEDLGRIADEQLKYQGGVYGYQRGEGEGAYSDLDTGLDKAIDPNKLALSGKFAEDYALTPEEAQNMKDVAANTVKGQYQREQDQLSQRAFAQGNTSPAQLAALQMQMGRQGAMDAGDAASAAELAANTEAARRQQTIEGMREGTEQDISNRLTGAAGTRYGARTGQANTLAANELAGINAAEGTRLAGTSQAAGLGYDAARTGGAAQIDAAKTGGQAAIDAARVAGDYGYRAADTGGQAGIDTAKYTGTQRLASDTGQQVIGQGLAGSADAASSARSTGIAGQRIAGQGNVRNYYTGQQAQAQQGGQTATGQRIQAQGTQGGLVNQATGTAASTATGEKTIDKQPGSAERFGQAAFSAFVAKGGVFDKPTSAVIGEHGPEMVMPLGPRRRYRMAA